MARLLTAGFESGKFDELNGAYSIAATPDVSSSIRRTGTYSIRLGKTMYFSHVFSVSVDELYFRMAMYVNDPVESDDPTDLIYFKDEDGGRQISIYYSQSDFCLDWYVGATKVANGNIVIPVQTWVVLEGHILIDAAAGDLTLKVNGTTDAQFTGDTLATTTANIRSIWWQGGGGVGTFGYFDDIAVNSTSGIYQNTWVGLGGIFYLEPTADGDQTDWTPSSGTVNYAMVDDIPPDNATTYNQGDTVGEIDLYQVDDCPEYINTINLVEVVYRAALVTSGENQLTDLVKVSGTVYSGIATTIVPITPSFTYYKGTIHYVNPATGTAWGTAEVNAMQAGLEVTA